MTLVACRFESYCEGLGRDMRIKTKKVGEYTQVDVETCGTKIELGLLDEGEKIYLAQQLLTGVVDLSPNDDSAAKEWVKARLAEIGFSL